MRILGRVTAVGSVLALLIGAGMTTSCGKKKKDSSSSADTSITVAGQLSLTGESTSFNLANPALTDLDVYCVSFQIPPVAGTGEVGEDGAFELTLDTTDASIGCFILKETEVLGSIVFEDPSETDLAGEKKTNDRLAFSGGRSDFGAISLDLTTGKAVVDISKIVTTGSGIKDTNAIATDFDFTGLYKAEAAGIDLPKGYSDICAARLDGGDDCRGPSVGEPLWLKLIKGVKNGTDTPRHAMMIWQSEDLFNQCGKKLGFTYEQGKAKGIDFTNSGVTQGEFDWDPAYVDGWKKTDARARSQMMRMENVDNFKGYPGTKQYFTQYRTYSCTPNQPCDPSSNETLHTNSPGFQFNANTKETGCKDASGKPVQMNDWADMQCTWEALTGASAGLSKNVCKKTVNGSEVTCTNIGGTFDANSNALSNAMTRYPEDYEVYAKGAFCDKDGDSVFDNGEWPEWGDNGPTCSTGTMVQGELCSGINTTTDAGKIAQMRCYMEANGDGHGGSAESCVRDIRANWNAKTPDEFIAQAEGPAKAQGEHVFDLFQYDSPTSGSIRSESRDFRGIRVGDNWTDCEVQEVFSLALRKMDGSNDLLVEMVSNERNVSTKPACIAEFGEGKTHKYLFKMVKQ